MVTCPTSQLLGVPLQRSVARRASVGIASTPPTCRRTGPANPGGKDTHLSTSLPRSAASPAPGQSPSSGPKTPSRADAGQPDSLETARTSGAATVPPGRPSPPAIARTPDGSAPGCRHPECLCPRRRFSTARLPTTTRPGTTASRLPPPAPGVGRNSSAGHATPDRAPCSGRRGRVRPRHAPTSKTRPPGSVRLCRSFPLPRTPCSTASRRAACHNPPPFRHAR